MLPQRTINRVPIRETIQGIYAIRRRRLSDTGQSSPRVDNQNPVSRAATLIFQGVGPQSTRKGSCTSCSTVGVPRCERLVVDTVRSVFPRKNAMIRSVGPSCIVGELSSKGMGNTRRVELFNIKAAADNFSTELQ